MCGEPVFERLIHGNVVYSTLKHNYLVFVNTIV